MVKNDFARGGCMKGLITILLIAFILIFSFLNFYPKEVIIVENISIKTYNYQVFRYILSINKERNTFFISKKTGTDIFYYRERFFPFPIKLLMPFSDTGPIKRQLKTQIK